MGNHVVAAVDYTHLTNSGKMIILRWIPSHVSIVGKSAHSLPITNMKLLQVNFFLRSTSSALTNGRRYGLL